MLLLELDQITLGLDPLPMIQPHAHGVDHAIRCASTARNRGGASRRWKNDCMGAPGRRLHEGRLSGDTRRNAHPRLPFSFEVAPDGTLPHLASHAVSVGARAGSCTLKALQSPDRFAATKSSMRAPA